MSLFSPAQIHQKLADLGLGCDQYLAAKADLPDHLRPQIDKLWTRGDWHVVAKNDAQKLAQMKAAIANQTTPITNPKTRAAAVLIGLYNDPETGADGVLLTRRAASLTHHSGQVSFPGGGLEAGEGPLQAALRECQEETGFPQTQVDIFARLPDYETRTGFHITPFVAHLHPPYNFVPEPSEVAHIFHLPLAKAYGQQGFAYRDFQFGKAASFQHYAMDWQGELIWGATASILVGLKNLILRAGDISDQTDGHNHYAN